MRQHAKHAQYGFVAGVRTMLGAAIGTLRGACARRRTRRGDAGVDLGGYPMDMLRDPRFTAGRRPVA